MRQNRLNVSRRDLLKSSALGCTAAALGGPLVMRGSAAATDANSKVNLAVVGCGGQGRSDLSELISSGAKLVALCDPDANQIEKARETAAKNGVAEARELRALARGSKVITQMGNQGSASSSLRRCIEIIQAGTLGQIREIYEWGIGCTAREGSAEGEDPVPTGFNWDLWVGPSAMRPFKKDVYHPARWRGWFDFGNGGLADFCCHSINLPMRALNLGYPERLVTNVGRSGQQSPGKPAVEFHFPARGELAPVKLYWQGNGMPPAEVLAPVVAVHKEKDGGVLMVGEKGCIYSSHWNTGALIRLGGESRLTDVLRHPATQDIPQSLPRSKGHAREWIDACRGEGRPFSDFDLGGTLTEIGLAGVLAIRTGRDLDWDGETMAARNAPEAAHLIRTEHRRKWLI
jgi:predicted dehydrogenase